MSVKPCGGCRGVKAPQSFDSFGSLFFTDIQAKNATVVQFQECDKQQYSNDQAVVEQKKPPGIATHPRQLNRDVALTLVRSWIKLDLSEEIKREMLMILQCQGDDGPT